MINYKNKSFYDPENIGLVHLVNQALRANLLYQNGRDYIVKNNEKVPQNESSHFHPASPYGVAKLYAHWITINYREAYEIFASNGILFNHESPRRGETFVTQKIVQAMCNIKMKRQKTLWENLFQ